MTTKTLFSSLALLALATLLFVLSALVPVGEIVCIVCGGAAVIGSFLEYRKFAEAAYY